MKVNLSHSNQQGQLFDLPPSGKIPSAGAARAHYGNIVEGIVCKALDLTPLRISSSFEVNWDARNAGGDFFEIKSLRAKNKAPIYEWRLQKDKKALDGCRHIRSLTYLFAVHRAGKASTLEEAFERMVDTIDLVIAVPFSRIFNERKKFDLQFMKTEKESGYNRKGYEDGYYNFPFAWIDSLGVKREKEISKVVSGREFNFKLRICK